MSVNTATARYEGLGKDGKGHVATKSGALDAPYGFQTRFEDAAGTNPEEQIAAAHASCFTMATSFALAGEGFNDGTLETTCEVTLEKDGDGFKVSKSALSLSAKVPGIDKSQLEEITAGTKANCPISKLLSCEITLEVTLSA
ncbi:OsmC family protein [Novosphingobium sp. BW1]|uniref:OsmC family protein n=1 Tax=Novosphingobium sp. BW1 TaxID=2592621 RepID=UPI0011DECCCE|nr:OsmC family protein [Novosphingobium sp. BW1]TYC85058.1 OsmC family protein [Novosphingobium sp. BW1]